MENDARRSKLSSACFLAALGASGLLALANLLRERIDFLFPDSFQAFRYAPLAALAALATLASFVLIKGRKDALFHLLLGTVFGVMLYSLTLPPLGRPNERMKRKSCASNLKMIGLALRQYALDNGGAYPAESGARGFERLRESLILTDSRLLVCPDCWKKTERAFHGQAANEKNVSYLYIGGLSEGSPPDSPLVIEKEGNHWRFGNVLFVDGRVEGLSALKLDELLKAKKLK